MPLWEAWKYFFHHWKDCTGCKKLNLLKLQIQCGETFTLTLWESVDLIEKTLSAQQFLKETKKCAGINIKHRHIQTIERTAIKNKDSNCHSQHVVLHFNFAENWRISLSSEVHRQHWRTGQIFLFVCVTTMQLSTKRFATANYDLQVHQSSAHMYALPPIVCWGYARLNNNWN